jgi:hypothetical protein
MSMTAYVAAYGGALLVMASIVYLVFVRREEREARRMERSSFTVSLSTDAGRASSGTPPDAYGQARAVYVVSITSSAGDAPRTVMNGARQSSIPPPPHV